MNSVTIDDHEADEVEAEHWRQFVKGNFNSDSHEKPIRHYTFEYAQRLAREGHYVV